MAASITRLTLYSLISAIEEDFRSLLSDHINCSSGYHSVFDASLLKKLAERLDADVLQVESFSLEDLLVLTDYGDVIQLAFKHKNALPEVAKDAISSLSGPLQDLISTRNRVMHSRPLEYDDLAKTLDLAEGLLANPEIWPRLAAAKRLLADNPDSILGLNIPFEPDHSPVSHNLPLPEFDETGFVGRRVLVQSLMKALRGIYPVVTIVGEGGLGKTSLALKVAYELLDGDAVQFDAITFVSAKTSQLTDTEITRIRGAINTSVGLFESAALALGGDSSSGMDALIELMSEFRVLLIIDNLETVLDDKVREFMERLPEGSKVLITTRIRMGAFEFPIQLEGLSPSEATLLLRATAKARGCGRLFRMPDKKLQDFCRRMRNNPLHIKWFVSAVQAGQRPEAVLADDKLFLQFCLSNVFNVVSEDGRRLLRTLLSLGGSYTVAELSFLTELGQAQLMAAISELLRTNMFFASGSNVEGSLETKYELNQLARLYLSRFYPVKREEQQRLLGLKRQLVGAGEQIASEAGKNPFLASSIHCRSRSDWVIAKYLREALSRIRSEELQEAFDGIDKAKALAPDFSETFRIEAYAHVRAGNVSSAYDSYEKAIELNPNSAVTRLLFGGFLLREVHDSEGALEQFAEAVRLSPGDSDPKIEYIRGSLYLRKFDQAERMIEAINSLPVLHEHTKKKILDLNLQLFLRRADYYESTHEPVKSLEALEEARTFYNSITFPDARMKERVAKGIVTAARLRMPLSDNPEAEMRLREVTDWIAGFANQERSRPQASSVGLELATYGVIKRIHRTGRFGFIGSDDGQEIFFHQTSVLPEFQTEVAVGCRVAYEIGVDMVGRFVAKQIRLS